MGQGTTRVIDDAAVNGRVRQLGDEITDVRRRLDALVMNTHGGPKTRSSCRMKNAASSYWKSTRVLP